MQFRRKTLPMIVLLLWSGFLRSTNARVSYEDIKSVEATCDGKDSCKVPRSKFTGILESWKYNCNCDSLCSIFGTCCVDSEYRGKYKQKDLKNLECRFLKTDEVFLYPFIRKCNPNSRHSKTIEELCTNQRLTYTQSDPFLDLPVYDPVTGITYQNYYCFACNENSGEERLIPWDIAIGGDTEKVNKSNSVPNLRNYDTDRWTWVVDNDNKTQVSLWPSIPDGIINDLPFCYGFEIISECAPSYTNENIREKCLEYMALTRIRNGTKHSWFGDTPQYAYYRNPHCAICNYANMDDMICMIEFESPAAAGGGVVPSGDFFVRLFAFSEEKVECRNNRVYDHFTKKCRNIYRARKTPLL